jgi:hypothetical protein
MKNSVKTEYMLLVLIIGMLSAIIFHYSRFAFIGNYAPFLDTFLHAPINIFSDYYSINNAYFLQKYAAAINYFPSTFIILDFLQVLTGSNPYQSIQIILAIFLLLLVPFIFKSLSHLDLKLRILSTFTLIFCNYPIIFTLHTGNFEMICFILVAYGLSFGMAGRFILAAILIGSAASIKVYPIIFLLAFINRENFIKVCFFAFLSILMLTCVGLMMHGDFFNNLNTYIVSMDAGLKFYRDHMIGTESGMHFGHALLNSARIIYPSLPVNKYIPYVSAIGLLFFIFSVYLSTKVKAVYLKILLPLCVICLFPPVSTDYKLIYFTLPLLLLLSIDDCRKIVLINIVLICLLLIPKDYIYFNNNIYQNLNSILNTLIILILFLISAFNAMKSKGRIQVRSATANGGLV